MPFKPKPCPHNSERQCSDCTKEKKRLAEAKRRLRPGVAESLRTASANWYAKPENKQRAKEMARTPEAIARSKANGLKPKRRAKKAECRARKHGHPWAPGQMDYVIGLFSAPILCCAVCGAEETEESRLHVDHCHSTGLVRGLLCGKHNHALGLVDDSASVLRSMAGYVDFHNSRKVRAA